MALMEFANQLKKKKKDFDDFIPDINRQNVSRAVSKAPSIARGAVNMFLGNTIDTVNRGGRILFEGARYAASPEIRQQVRSGDASKIKTIAETSPQQMLGTTAKSVLEIAPWGHIAKLKPVAKLLKPASKSFSAVTKNPAFNSFVKNRAFNNPITRSVATNIPEDYAWNVIDRAQRGEGIASFRPGMEEVYGAGFAGAFGVPGAFGIKVRPNSKGTKSNIIGGKKGKGFKVAQKKGETFKGLKDTEARFEIDDSKSKLKKPIKVGSKGKLSDFLDHEDLYKNYPHTKDIPVQGKTGTASGGTYNRTRKDITLNPEGSVDQRKTLIEEVQHNIQDTEGFPGGASVAYSSKNPEKVKGMINDLITIENQRKYLESDPVANARLIDNLDRMEGEILADPDFVEGYTNYMRTEGELEADAVLDRIDFTPEQRRATDPYATVRGKEINDPINVTPQVDNDSWYRIIHPEDRKRMVEFIDYVRLNKFRKKEDLQLELDASRMAEQFGIPVKKQTLGELANSFEATLTARKERHPRDMMNVEMDQLPESIKNKLENNEQSRRSVELPSMDEGQARQSSSKENPFRAAGSDLPDEIPFESPKERAIRDSQVRNQIGNDLSGKTIDDINRDLAGGGQKVDPIESIRQNKRPEDISDADIPRRSEERSAELLKMNEEQRKAWWREALSNSEMDPIELNNFSEYFAKWIGKRKASEAHGIREALKFKDIPEEQAWKVIFAMEDPRIKASPEVKDTIASLRQAFDQAYVRGQKAGLDLGYLENYITHIWEEAPEEVSRMYQAAKQSFQFAKERKIPTYEEGLQMGLTPKYKTPQQILGAYVANMNRSIADIDFVEGLKDSGLLVEDITDSGKGWTAFSYPGLTGGQIYYAPEKVAETLQKVLSPEIKSTLAKVANVTSTVAGKLQDISLSGGVYGTPINAFTVANATKEMLSGRMFAPIKATWQSISDKSSKRFFENHIDSIIEMQERNIPIRANLDIENINKSALKQWTEKNLPDKVGDAWNAAVNDPTFKRFMPIMTTNFYMDTRNNLVRGGMDVEKAKDIAAKATKNFYGLIGTDTQAQRSKLTSDLMTTALFAPRYRESMINFWVNNIKAIPNFYKPEYRANAGFMVGAGAMLGSMIMLAQNYENEGWEFRDGVLYIPMGEPDESGDRQMVGIPYLSSIATMPRMLYRVGADVVQGNLDEAVTDAFASSGSILLKPIADITRNQDYFGNEIYDEQDPGFDQIKDAGTYVAGQWVPSVVRTVGQTPWGNEQAQKIGLGMDDEEYTDKRKSNWQLASEAAELPLRFSSTNRLKGRNYFETRDKVLQELSPEERSVYEVLHPDEENTSISKKQNKMAEAQLRLANPSVLEAETRIARETAEKNGEPMNPFYALQPWQQKTVLVYDSLAPGEDEASQIIQGNPWIKDYWNARSEFFDDLKTRGKFEEEVGDQFIEYDGQTPLRNNVITPSLTLFASPELQAKMDYYFTLPEGAGERSAFLDANPDILNYWDASGKLKNVQRLEMGLPLKEQKSYSRSSGGGSGSRRGRSRAWRDSQGRTRSMIETDLKQLQNSLAKQELMTREMAIPTQSRGSIRIRSTARPSGPAPKIRIVPTQARNPLKSSRE